MQSTRNKLIELLVNNKKKYISGQDLAEQLQISRSAVWKQMKALEKAGYKVEAKEKLGYRVVEAPNIVNEHTIQWGLDTVWLGKRVVHKVSTPSTQLIAHQYARDNAEDGTIIIADEQTASKGRTSKEWHSMKGKGMWLSMIIKPNILPYLAPQLTLLTATVLADTIRTHTAIEPQIKWPNDILIDGKKVAGILTEMQAEQDKIQYVVIGIGLNVNQDKNDFPDGLHDTATSLSLAANQQWSIRDLIQKFLITFEKRYNTYLDAGFPQVKTKWESYGYKIGELIWLKTMKKRWQGTFLGIAEDGALLVRTDDGQTEKIYSAEIEWFNKRGD